MKPNGYKSILFTSNLSAASRIAFGHAAMLANQYRAKLVLLHVMERLPSNYEGYMVGLFGDGKFHEVLKQHREEAKHALVGKVSPRQMARTALNEFCRESTDIEGYELPQSIVVVKEGEVVEVILQQAAEHGCDLIVMGAGEGVLTGVAVGHTIKSVLKSAKIPVLIVPEITAE
jgi:nucleotide-binding universal stress UspA family protein